MAHSISSRSLSPPPRIAPASSSSASEDEYSQPPTGTNPSHAPSASRGGSPESLAAGARANMRSLDFITCQWEDCGIVFTHLPTLIDHIHNEHIGMHKSNYTCEWSTCSRRGYAQTSRYALISHIRSHTGEKPCICPIPECDKSFTRSDALAKHMRQQHNMTLPLPASGRGGNRRRNRQDAEAQANPNPNDGRNGRADLSDTYPTPFVNHIQERMQAEEDSADDEDDLDGIPPYLLSKRDPTTGLIHRRTPTMVKYLLTKAKYKHAVSEHDHLLEELKMAEKELAAEKDAKEVMLDDMLRTRFGSQADWLIDPVPIPQSVLAAENSYERQMNGESHANGLRESQGSLPIHIMTAASAEDRFMT